MDASPAGEPRKRKKKRAKAKIIVNLSNCKYEVLKTSAEKFGWTVTYEEEDTNFNLFWIDTGVAAERLMKLKRYQKINHFPNMSFLARKARMGKTLNRMLVVHGKEYKFFPQTWSLPAEWSDFMAQFAKGKKNRTYIVKPDAGCQGRGIFLTRTYENVSSTDPLVVQRYLTDPYLIEGLKFDLRVYIVVTSCDPLRVYMFKDGLVRLCTEPYVAPNGKNMSQTCMHLTNYAINKHSSNFVFNDDAERTDIGHKRSIQWLFTYLDEHGCNAREVWDRIGDMITKTLIAGQPALQHAYRASVSADDDGYTCFEVLGFDIMLDSKLRPWLIEVNHSPNFTCDTPFDMKIKSTLVSETMQLIRIVEYDKKRIDAEDAAGAHGRLYGGSGAPTTPVAKRTPEDVARAVHDQEMKRFEWLARIYPPLEFAEVQTLLANAADAGVTPAIAHSLMYPDEAQYEAFVVARKAAYDSFLATSKDQFERGITSKTQALLRGKPPVVTMGTVVPSLPASGPATEGKLLKPSSSKRDISATSGGPTPRRVSDAKDGVVSVHRPTSSSSRQSLADHRKPAKRPPVVPTVRVKREPSLRPSSVTPWGEGDVSGRVEEFAAMTTPKDGPPPAETVTQHSPILVTRRSEESDSEFEDIRIRTRQSPSTKSPAARSQTSPAVAAETGGKSGHLYKEKLYATRSSAASGPSSANVASSSKPPQAPHRIVSRSARVTNTSHEVEAKSSPRVPVGARSRAAAVDTAHEHAGFAVHDVTAAPIVRSRDPLSQKAPPPQQSHSAKLVKPSTFSFGSISVTATDDSARGGLSARDGPAGGQRRGLLASSSDRHITLSVEDMLPTVAVAKVRPNKLSHQAPAAESAFGRSVTGLSMQPAVPLRQPGVGSSHFSREYDVPTPFWQSYKR